MHASYGIFLATFLVIYLIRSTEGTQCWICSQARSHRDCIFKGYTKTCRPNEICETEFRYSGFRVVITKGCKQARACMNDQYQNAQLSNGRSQCGPGQHNSVCRCCCDNNNCNKNLLSCNNAIRNSYVSKKPKCRPLYLPNGYKRCYGTADRLSIGTRCRFSCKAGYGVEGARYVSCGRRGTQADWSGSVPTCKRKPTCGRLRSRSFTNGIVRCNGRSQVATLGTSCVYRCKPRYAMVENGVRKSSGNYERTVCTMLRDVPTWSKQPPICVEEKCRKATTLDHGFARCTNSDELGSVCTFICLGGYDLVGSEKVTCVQKAGYKDWDRRLPTCRPKPCPVNTFDEPSLQKNCSHGNQFGSICTIACQPGYHVAELVKRPRAKKYISTCEVRGEGVDWNRPAPTCKAKKCPRISAPEEAEFKCTNDFEYMSSCTFSCPAPERVLVGNPVLTCEDDGDQSKPNGKWNKAVPKCDLKECPELNAEATNVKCTDKFVYGTICTFSCKPGYHMLGNDGVSVVESGQPATTTCSLRNDQVVWSNAPPKCERQRCSEISATPGLSILCDNNVEIGSKCSFSCRNGYDMIGKAAAECAEGAPNQILGRWSDSAPVCQRKSCNRVNYNELTTDVACTNDFKYESVCTIGCKEGYFMRKDTGTVIDRVKTTCLYDQGGVTWSEIAPTCQPKQCIAIRNIANGKMSCSRELIFGATCEFSCDRGYDLVGSNRIICTDDDNLSDRGQWSSTAPSCEPRKCPSMGIDETTVDTNCNNGNSFKSICELKCKPQHFIRDAQGRTSTFSITTTCGIGGDGQMNWAPKPFSCEPVTCPTPKASDLVSTCSDGNKTGSVCIFSCPPGFRARGNITNRCVSIGQYDADWSNSMPTCRVRKCANQAIDANMLRTCTAGNNYDSTCSFTCRRNRGLYMTGANDTVAIESGTLESTCTVRDTNLMSWTEDLPKCIVKSCPVRSDPVNGRFRCLGGNTLFRSRCTYICDSGYRRVGPFIVTCLEGERNSSEGKWNVGRARCVRRRTGSK